MGRCVNVNFWMVVFRCYVVSFNSDVQRLLLSIVIYNVVHFQISYKTTQLCRISQVSKHTHEINKECYAIWSHDGPFRLVIRCSIDQLLFTFDYSNKMKMKKMQ